MGDGRFKEGNDPRRNAGGRPKLPSEFKRKCREFTDESVFAAWRQEVLERGEHWMKAAELLAAYGHGKPTQPLAGGEDDDGNPTGLVVQLVKAGE